MSNKDPFDFGAFVANANNPDPDVKKKVLNEAVGEEMETVMGEVAPRLWCILQEQMMLDPKNNIHLNAVMNAGIFALLSWVCACTPPGETDGRDNDTVLREKIMVNLDNALTNASKNASEMSSIAHSAGKLKLMDDAMKGMSTVLTANSQIIQGIHSTIKNMQPKA